MIMIICFYKMCLMQVWCLVGWFCKDGFEIDLLVVGLIVFQMLDGCEILWLIEVGIWLLVESCQWGQWVLSVYDWLGQCFVEYLLVQGCVVWCELLLWVQVEDEGVLLLDMVLFVVFWQGGDEFEWLMFKVWCMVWFDFFLVCNIMVEVYLQLQVYEIKVSCVDLLFDLCYVVKC